MKLFATKTPSEPEFLRYIALDAIAAVTLLPYSTEVILVGGNVIHIPKDDGERLARYLTRGETIPEEVTIL